MKNIYITCTTIALALGLVALSPMTQAVVPPPDGGYPGGNTAEGQNALVSRTTGISNTANQNTATGAGALLSNTTGDSNTANGTFALFTNSTGASNTAAGTSALQSNTT